MAFLRDGRFQAVLLGGTFAAGVLVSLSLQYGWPLSLVLPGFFACWSFAFRRTIGLVTVRSVAATVLVAAALAVFLSLVD